MKPRIGLAIGCAIIASCFASGQSQDNSRGVDPLDLSVHASIDQQPQEAQPSLRPPSRPTMLSSWSHQPAKQDSATNVWRMPATTSDPAEPTPGNNSLPLSSFEPGRRTPGTAQPPRASASAPMHAADGALGKPLKRSSGFDILPHEHARGGLSPSLGATESVSPVFVPPQIQPFHTPFQQGQTGSNNASFQSEFAGGKDRIKARQHSLKPKARHRTPQVASDSVGK
jgi:hypothetical protein